MLRMEEILRMEMSVSHWNGFFEWNNSKYSSVERRETRKKAISDM
jgi:hypothetical protein